MEIRPVSIDTIALGADGRTYEVTGEAGRIVHALREIDDTIVVHYNEKAQFFTVAQRLPRRDDPLTTRDIPFMRVMLGDWDERVVRDVAMRNHELRHGRSAAERLDREDAEVRKAQDHALTEMIGAACAPLFHAFQKDAGLKPRVFVPRAIAA